MLTRDRHCVKVRKSNKTTQSVTSDSRTQRTFKVHVAHLFRLLSCYAGEGGGEPLSCTFQSVCVIARRVHACKPAVPCSTVVSCTLIWRSLSSVSNFVVSMHLYWKAKNIFGDYAADALLPAAVPRSTFIASVTTASTTQLELEEVHLESVVGQAPRHLMT